MATRTPRSTTTPKTPAAPSAAPSASKQTARSKSAAATGLRGKSVEVTAPVPAPPTPPAPKQVALSLIDEKPKKKKVASVLRPFKALPSISKLNEPEVVEVPKEPEVEVAVEVAADHGARVEPVAEVLTEEDDWELGRAKCQMNYSVI